MRDDRCGPTSHYGCRCDTSDGELLIQCQLLLRQTDALLNVVSGVLTDYQLDFKPAVGLTIRQRLRPITDAIAFLKKRESEIGN